MRSRDYWKRAAFRQLNLCPDLDGEDADDSDDRVGPRFLWEFEETRKKAVAEGMPNGHNGMDSSDSRGEEKESEPGYAVKVD